MVLVQTGDDAARDLEDDRVLDTVVLELLLLTHLGVDHDVQCLDCLDRVHALVDQLDEGEVLVRPREVEILTISPRETEFTMSLMSSFSSLRGGCTNISHLPVTWPFTGFMHSLNQTLQTVGFSFLNAGCLAFLFGVSHALL